MKLLAGIFLGSLLSVLGGIAALFWGATRRPW